MAVFPFILTRLRQCGDTFLNHEQIHLRQQLEMGVIPFYLWYFTEYLIRLTCLRNHYQAYRAISFEREAYAMENDCAYLKRRGFWAFLEYL
jgi:hypothetical protein